MEIINQPADQALFDGVVAGLVVTLYEDERPPGGLLGALDWAFHGQISSWIKEGVLSGKRGECTYFPISRNGFLYHLIVVGCGCVSTSSTIDSSVGRVEKVRKFTLEPQSLEVQTLQKNLVTLKFSHERVLGVSKSDFGYVSAEYFYEILGGVRLCILP